MDLGLEDMDGLTLTEKIRKIEDGSHIPIVAMTAHNAADVKESCLKVGMNDFLNKPLTIAKASEILKKFKP
jgi:CheY-like chemotaxis protein